MTTGADSLDLASEREEFFRNNALRMRKPEGPVANGHCHFCDEPVATGMRWCDADCQRDWEREKKR